MAAQPVSMCRSVVSSACQAPSPKSCAYNTSVSMLMFIEANGSLEHRLFLSIPQQTKWFRHVLDSFAIGSFPAGREHNPARHRGACAIPIEVRLSFPSKHTFDAVAVLLRVGRNGNCRSPRDTLDVYLLKKPHLHGVQIYEVSGLYDTPNLNA